MVQLRGVEKSLSLGQVHADSCMCVCLLVSALCLALLICKRLSNCACYAADGEGKVNYFEMATNLRTLKVR